MGEVRNKTRERLDIPYASDHTSFTSRSCLLRKQLRVSIPDLKSLKRSTSYYDPPLLGGGRRLLPVDLYLIPYNALANISCDRNSTALPLLRRVFVFQPWTLLPLDGHVAVVVSVQLVSGRPQ